MSALADELTDLDLTLAVSCGQDVAHVALDAYHGAIRSLLDHGYLMCTDLTVVDHLERDGRQLPEGVAPERFELVVNLLDLTARRRLRVLVQVADGTDVPSITDLHPGAEAMEREAFDMFGLVFTGHPDLTRILMPETWVGHPLRKDFSSGRIPVQFKGAHQGR